MEGEAEGVAVSELATEIRESSSSVLNQFFFFFYKERNKTKPGD
jgi:hypothetical protein